LELKILQKLTMVEKVEETTSTKDAPPKSIDVPSSEIKKPTGSVVKKPAVAEKSLRVLIHDLGGMDAKTVEDSLAQLLAMELWDGNKKRLQEAISMGAPSAVLRAMANFGKSSKSIAEKCLAMLLGLTVSDTKDCVGVISELDGCKAVIEAMKDYEKDVQIQAHSCGLLCNMSTWSTKDATRIVKLGGIDLVIKAMKSYPDLADIQRRGCKCLGNLAAVNSAYKEQIRTKKGLTLFAYVMENYPAKHAAHMEARKAMALYT